ncbi:hypothetical protein Tco_1101423 [Tanacetum coccineum]
MSMRVLLAKERILKLIQVWDEEQIKPWSLPELLLQLSNDSQTINESLKQREEKRIESEQAANLAVQKEQEELAAFTPSWKFPMIDDDEEYSIQYKEYLESSNEIAPALPTVEPEDSLIMEDEHLNTIPEMESDEEIESSVKDLNLTPSESEDLSDYKSESSSVNSLRSIDPEEDIHLIEKLLNDDSSPRSPEELNFKISNVTIESFSLSHIPVVDSDFLIEEVDTFLVPKDSMPPGIESDGYNSEGDNIFLEELLNNDSLSQPEYESFHFDRYNIPSSPHRPEKPPDDGIYLDTQPSCKSGGRYF